MKTALIIFASALTLFTASGASKATKQPAKRKAPVARAAAKTAVNSHRRNPCVGAVVLDAANGAVLYEYCPAASAYPASVTKLMTALLVLEDVQGGRYRLDDPVVATADVYHSEPSWVGLKVGDKMSVRDLLYALMVESANDSAIALAVHSAGTLAAFVERMNARAAALGMKGTTYYNPNGLPPKGRYPWKKFNVSTAADQARLGLELVRKHPQILEFTSVKTCDLIRTADGYRVAVTRRVNGGEPVAATVAAGEKIVKTLKNHNNVMVKDKLKVYNSDGREAVDGLKTGYIDAGGSSVVMTGRRGKKRVIVAVLGSDGAAVRDGEARRLVVDNLGAFSW